MYENTILLVIRHRVSDADAAAATAEVAQLCWAAQGITAAEEPPDEFGHAG